jgi:protein-S-isoprenylcysteine O-methyltransferase Ste14
MPHPDLIPALWLLWAIGWTVSAFPTKRALRTEGIRSGLSHLIPLALGAALLIFPHAGGPFLDMRIVPRSAGTVRTGTTLVALGLGFAAWARIHLAGNWSGAVTLKQDHSLTRTGPYRWVRHPIYTGLLTAVLGSAIDEAAWRGLIGLALITLAFRRKITIEERFLTTQFGDAYTRYQREVPALIPWPAERR